MNKEEMFALTIRENNEQLDKAVAEHAGLKSRLENSKKGSLSTVTSNRLGSIISGVNFSGQTLEGTYGTLRFAECDFSGCDFSQAEITGVLQLTNCRLEGAKFPAEKTASLIMAKAKYTGEDDEEVSGVGLMVSFTHPKFEEFARKAGLKDD